MTLPELKEKHAKLKKPDGSGFLKVPLIKYLALKPANTTLICAQPILFDKTMMIELDMYKVYRIFKRWQ